MEKPNIHPRVTPDIIDTLDAFIERYDNQVFITRHLITMAKIYENQGNGSQADEHIALAKERIETYNLNIVL